MWSAISAINSSEGNSLIPGGTFSFPPKVSRIFIGSCPSTRFWTMQMQPCQIRKARVARRGLVALGARASAINYARGA